MSLQGKTILITGAASGIGAACAATVRAQGARVIAVDRNEPAAGLCDQFIRADLAQADSIDSVAKQVHGRLDALCNIAGLPPTKGRTPVLQVNFVGLRQLTLALLPLMNDGASIVNLASLAGFGWADQIGQVRALLGVSNLEDVDAFCEANGVDDARAYFLSKEALIAWTLQMRWAWRSRGIRMNAISPGPVETPIHQDFLKTLGKRAEEDMRLVERAGRPDDIAPLVVFLCGDGSRWMRGVNIPCDGGMAANILCQSSGLG
ncbi:SDR family oxidoreductase [Paraburkholderia sp. Ac-20342]|uniref:coniferyl-alcohol dehydrogenase n=1 Tax=Paraburkholderia sp. Ac-20342 TaxID=2703889 RepID=UPI00197E9AE2|nr:coniferyl-alcohol dehydrogenase [Paraburkholderia sp. Ac-20342]MBN3845895.1 SDR family oxidoreductase [Paraburkholderia sp. Ac-20342]